MNKWAIGLVCVVCLGLCYGQNNGYGRRYPHVQPPYRYRPFCTPCPSVFPPQQTQQNLPLCPCVKPPGSTKCVTYDNRLQAATLEEALYSFPDLGSRDPVSKAEPLFDASKEAQSLQESAKVQTMAGLASAGGPQMQRFAVGAPMPEADVAQTQAPPTSATSLSGGEYACNSPACKACLLKVVNGFIDSANSSTDQSTLAHFLSMRKQLEMEAGGAQCPGMDKSVASFNMMQEPALKVVAGAAPVQPVPPEVVAQIVKAIQPDGAAPQRRSTTDEDERVQLEAGVAATAAQKWDERTQFRPHSSTRTKRQSAAPTSSDLIGTATKLGCDYQRGTPIGDSKYIGLCNICWQWRKLPDKYFPSYLNEVSCDSKDDQCLAGWGKCRPVLRSVNVLVNRGTTDKPEWQQESIFTVAACECQVEIGSPLHTFVAR